MSNMIQTRGFSAHANCKAQRPPLTIWTYLSLMRQRRALARLDDVQLADLGLTRKEADTEANRPVWDVPSHWRE